MALDVEHKVMENMQSAVTAYEKRIHASDTRSKAMACCGHSFKPAWPFLCENLFLFFGCSVWRDTVGRFKVCVRDAR